MQVLCDIAIERAVLAIVYNHNYESFVEIQDILTEESFTYDSNKIIFKCFKTIFEQNDGAKLDYPSVYSAAKNIGLNHHFQDRSEVEHFEAITNFPAKRENLFDYARKLHNLHMARLIHGQLEEKGLQILEFDGSESLDKVLSMVEFDFSELLHKTDGAETMGSDLAELVDYLEQNPVDQVGLSIGYPKLEAALGGGYRSGSVTLFGARPGMGKSTICNNGANYTSSNGVYSLYLDTEMTKVDQQYRLLALNSGVKINQIETGKFAQNSTEKQKVLKAVENIKAKPYYHKCIAGMPFEQQLGLMRKWLITEIGLDEEKRPKQKAVIYYDYMKLMDAGAIGQSLAEYQALGFMITTLHNFAVRYDIPIIATVQLNRDGITKESTDAASGSDRLIWLCSNFIIFKPKSDEEIQKDGDIAGNRKMVVLKSRHGPGMDTKNYINYRLTGSTGLLEESLTSFEINAQNKENEVNEAENSEE